MTPIRLLSLAAALAIPLAGAAEARPGHHAPAHTAQVRSATYRVAGHTTHRARLHTAQLSTHTLHHRHAQIRRS